MKEVWHSRARPRTQRGPATIPEPTLSDRSRCRARRVNGPSSPLATARKGRAPSRSSPRKIGSNADPAGTPRELFTQRDLVARQHRGLQTQGDRSLSLPRDGSRRRDEGPRLPVHRGPPQVRRGSDGDGARLRRNGPKSRREEALLTRLRLQLTQESAEAAETVRHAVLSESSPDRNLIARDHRLPELVLERLDHVG